MFSLYPPALPLDPMPVEAIPTVPGLILAAGLWLAYMAIVKVSK